MKLRHSEPYGELRRKEYPPVGDQLDALYKLIKDMPGLPVEVQDWVNQIATIKAKYPKR